MTQKNQPINCKNFPKLEINNYLNNCCDRDVIAFGSKGLTYIKKLCDLVLSSIDINLTNTIGRSINQKISNQCKAELWFQDGEACEILKAGASDWQKGKLKLKINLSLEFIPDEPEIKKSPLDEVREEINLNSTTN